MTRLIPKSFLTEAKKYQQQHVKDMSREVTVITGNLLIEDCPNCYYDYVTDTSAASYTGFAGTITLFSGTAYEQTYEARNFRRVCPVCGGKGSFSVRETKTILAHVFWDYTRQWETYPNSPAGKEGQSQVKIKASSDYYEDFRSAEAFIVDGVEVEPSSTPIVRGLGQKDGIVELYCKTILSGDKDTRK